MEGITGEAYIQRFMKEWVNSGIRFKIYTQMDSDEAQEYLVQGGNKIAIIPSLVRLLMGSP